MVPLSLISSLYITSDYCIIHILAIISMPAKDNIHNFPVQFYLHFFMLYPSTLEINMSIFFFLSFTLLFFFFKLDFPGGSDGKASAYNARDLGSIPGSGRSPGEGNGNPLQYSCLENPMDRGAW